MWWAYTQGKEGKDFRQVRDAAANAGTLAHAMVEAFIRQRPAPSLPEDETGQRALRAYTNFQEWATRTQLKPVESELRLVSEVHRFGGTLDLMLIGGKLSLGDLKTSGSVYTEHLIQVAAYGILYGECFPDRPIEGGYHILRISREDGDFSHHFYSDLTDAAEMFLLLRRAYDLDRILKKRVR